MKRLSLAVLLFLATALPAAAQTYYDIDVDLAAWPEMEQVPDSPVYYAPGVDSNYFFYDGLYWDFYNDAWYASPWYNGPWEYVDPVYVPTYVLWVPVRYYHRPPHYFRHWNAHRPPQWGQRWGHEWQRRHNEVYRGRAVAAAPAPLPHYQRNFTRNNYPRGAQQYAVHGQSYGYQPREHVVRQHYQDRGMAPAQQRPAQPAPAQPIQRAAQAQSGQPSGYQQHHWDAKR